MSSEGYGCTWQQFRSTDVWAGRGDSDERYGPAGMVLPCRAALPPLVPASWLRASDHTQYLMPVTTYTD